MKNLKEEEKINELTTISEEVNNLTMKDNKKKQKTSIIYTLKSYKNNMEKLKESKMITNEEYNQLNEIHVKMLHRWIGLEMGI